MLKHLCIEKSNEGSELLSGKLVQICTQPYQMEVLIDNDTTTEEQGFTKCVKCKRICCDQLDPVSRVTGIPGWYWILGIKCSDTMGVGLVY